MTARLRADAQRNLERVVDAACECFAERGVDASVDEIAQRAGVGHGTVFRRFPSKDALLAAVLARELEALTAVAEEALADPDPGAGFERFLRAAVDAYRRNRVLVEGLDRCLELPQTKALEDVAGRLVRRARRAGALRRNIGPQDVFELVPAAARYPDVILAGLRPPGR